MPQETCPHCGKGQGVEPITIVVTSCQQKHPPITDELSQRKTSVAVDGTAGACCSKQAIPLENSEADVRLDCMPLFVRSYSEFDVKNVESFKSCHVDLPNTETLYSKSKYSKVDLNTSVVSTCTDQPIPIRTAQETQTSVSCCQETFLHDILTVQETQTSMSCCQQPFLHDIVTQTSLSEPELLPLYTRNFDFVPPDMVPSDILGRSLHNMSTQTSYDQLFISEEYYDEEGQDLRSRYLIGGQDTKRKNVSVSFGDDRLEESTSSKSEDFDEGPNDVPVLPVLTERYHGSGCAMEICIMEKHEPDCKFRKSKNRERNPIDDRCGDYDVVGRMSFRTCGSKKPENDAKFPNETQVYSLHVPLTMSFYKENDALMFNDANIDALLNFFRQEETLQNLILSDKNFPRNEQHFGGLFQDGSFIESLNNSFIHRGQQPVVEITKSEKSLQVDEFLEMSTRTERAHRKWFQVFFSCLRSEEESSRYALYESDNTSGDFSCSIGSQVNLGVYSQVL